MVSAHILRQRTARLDDSWDVIVVGGGPSGCAAAMAAQREGARTLLVEGTSCLGGMGTAGLIPAWCPFSDGEKIIYRGLAQRVFEESKKGVPHVSPEELDWVPINPEHLKRVYDELVTQAGVTVLFQSFVPAVEMRDEGTIDAILCANKAGLTALRAKVYVDCTGDGDIAAWAGAEHRIGDETSGETQPASHCFILSNVSTFDYLNGPMLHGQFPTSPIWQILDSGRYPLVRDEHLCQNLIGPDTVGFNAGHIWQVDGTSPESLSQALVLGRRIAESIRRGLAEFHPKAFGSAFLASAASLLGLRETRRITGDYVLTQEDYMARRSFPDEIARNSYFIDIHTSSEEIDRLRKGKVSLVENRFERYGIGESHGIPYRCLTPRGLTNVLTAGRCISADHVVQGSIRVMPVCLATGEAAGTASAMAARAADHDVHAVDADRLRQRLRDHGAYLPGAVAG